MSELVRRAASRLIKKWGSASQHDSSRPHTDNNSWKARRFQFRPLDHAAQQIRLLRLLPKTPDAATDAIACEIRPFDFASAPPFSALSWAWGTPYGIEEDIRVNDAAFKLTNPSLLNALQHLRRYFTNSGSPAAAPDWIWIDALCINQEDIQEKSNQVMLMASVYERARKVISWLGSGDPAITSAFSFIAETVRAARGSAASQAQIEMLIGREPVAISPGGAWDDPANSVDTIVDPRLIHLFSLSNDMPQFFSLQYWHRLWIVQELVRTRPKDNIIMYENDTMLFSDIQIFRDSWLEFLKRLQLLPQWEATLARTPGWEDIAASWPAYVRSMEDTLVVWSYYDFLRSVTTSGDNLFYIVLSGAYISVDPRDKVYGFLGLASPRVQAQVLADYSKQTKDIYTEWFTSVLVDWASLDPLYFAGLNSRTYSAPMGGLPSWVPDLRRSIRESPVWDATLGRTLERKGKGPRFRFSAFNSPRPFHVGGEELRCSAILASAPVSVLPLEGVNIDLAHIYNALARFPENEDRTALSVLVSIFWALMCGIDRFNAAEAARRLRSAEEAVMQPETSTNLGHEQFQLVRSMPLMQAVAKLTLQRNESALTTKDNVLTALCMDSRRLGTDAIADTLLILAFIRLYLSSMASEEDISTFTSQLGLDQNCDLRSILEALYRFVSAPQSQDTALAEVEVERLLNSEAIPGLQQTLTRYLEAFEHTLFVTNNGMIGNGPRAMRTGDQIILFDDVQMPFVVRKHPSGGRYELVGPCYVQGISDGELAAAARRGEVEPVEILLV
ncbi:heterokaryon incompatibility protein-domain-containing protein [Immersiella caudata]|uniref:Heterokaryon incompatibility protein-domain-containing protein n=1 Tax=Immersiella caudata TaxID=314043 RepID=A0AA40CCW2_9PEZI|nr:heterokaryon incompatibility protein-domain-containing protein [Immersiella caudata]